MNSNPPNQWKKGQSGNPNGRPLAPLSDALRKAVAKTIKTKDGKKVVTQDAMANAIVGEALKGNVQAFNVIANRIEGMPAQPIEQTGEMNLNVNDMLEKVYGDTGSDSTE